MPFWFSILCMHTYLLDAHVILKFKILCFCKGIYSFVFLSPFNLEAQLTWFSRVTFIGIKLLYNVVPVSVVQWSESGTCIHISPPSWPSLLPPNPSRLGHQRHWVEPPVLYSKFPLSFFFFDSFVFYVYSLLSSIMQMLDFLYWSCNFHIVSLLF